MLALLWMIGRALFDFAGTVRRLPPVVEERWVLHGAIAATIAVLFGGYFELNLGDSEVLALILAVIGCGYVAVYAARERSAAA